MLSRILFHVKHEKFSLFHVKHGVSRETSRNRLRLSGSGIAGCQMNPMSAEGSSAPVRRAAFGAKRLRFGAKSAYETALETTQSKHSSTSSARFDNTRIFGCLRATSLRNTAFR